jgi:hypothetical protein
VPDHREVERPGCLSLFALPFAVWLSVVMPGNHLVHHTFWAGVGDVLLVTALIFLLGLSVQAAAVNLLGLSLLSGRGGLILQVPYWAVVVGLYWVAVEHNPSDSYGIVSDRLLGVFLGGTVVAVPVLASWRGMAVRKIAIESARVERALRANRYYD